MSDTEITALQHGGKVSIRQSENEFHIVIEDQRGLRSGDKHIIILRTRESVAKLREQCDLWLATQ